MGKCFLEQLAQLAVRQPDTKLNICYVATSKKMVVARDYANIGVENVLKQMDSSESSPFPLATLADFLTAAPSKSVLVDNTSS